MRNQGISEEEFIEALAEGGLAYAAKKFGISTRNVYARRARLEKKLGCDLFIGDYRIQPRKMPEKAMVPVKINNGVVLIGSDCHYWSEVSTAHLAFLDLCKKLKPSLVILNGDVIDGARISRHPPIGWEGKPTLLQELQVCRQRLRSCSKLSK